MRCTLVACVSVPSTSARYLLTVNHFDFGLLFSLIQQKTCLARPRVSGNFINVSVFGGLFMLCFGGSTWRGGVLCLLELAPS